MAKKKPRVADTKKNLQVKSPLSHKGFYTLLLTALLGMFIFVSYYASQQVQVYRSNAADQLKCPNVNCRTAYQTEAACKNNSNCCGWQLVFGYTSECDNLLATTGGTGGTNCANVTCRFGDALGIGSHVCYPSTCCAQVGNSCVKKGSGGSSGSITVGPGQVCNLNQNIRCISGPACPNTGPGGFGRCSGGAGPGQVCNLNQNIRCISGPACPNTGPGGFGRCSGSTGIAGGSPTCSGTCRPNGCQTNEQIGNGTCTSNQKCCVPKPGIPVDTPTTRGSPLASAQNCTHQGKACGNNPGGPGCCPPNVCRNKNAQGVGTCLAPAGGGGGGTGTNACTTAGGTCKMKANGCSSTETNINKDCAGPNPADKICCKASSGGGLCSSAGGVCRATSCLAGETKLTGNYCTTTPGKVCCKPGVSGTPTPTPTPTPGACGSLTDEASCTANSQCAWNAASGWCGDNCSLITDQNTCTVNQYCAWDAESGSCVADGWTPTTSGTPTPTPGATGTATFDLSLSFQGITTTPLSGQDTMDVLVTLSGGALTSDVPSTGTFTVDDNGVWTGEVSFPNVPAGDGYKLLVKGPKHLQKKVCDSTPTETSPGTYHCGDGNITISTSSTNTLDFSGIKLLVGDLPAQDGIVDSYDISLVRNGFCTTDNPDICHDSTLLSQADLNLDGIIDSQDYSLLISSLSVKYDEQ